MQTSVVRESADGTSSCIQRLSTQIPIELTCSLEHVTSLRTSCAQWGWLASLKNRKERAALNRYIIVRHRDCIDAKLQKLEDWVDGKMTGDE